jgi:hypothetical protein
MNVGEGIVLDEMRRLVEDDQIPHPAEQSDVGEVRLIGKPDLLEHDRSFDSIRCVQRIELQAVGVLRWPAAGDWEGRDVGHERS